MRASYRYSLSIKGGLSYVIKVLQYLSHIETVDYFVPHTLVDSYQSLGPFGGYLLRLPVPISTSESRTIFEQCCVSREAHVMLERVRDVDLRVPVVLLLGGIRHRRLVGEAAESKPEVLRYG